MYNWFVLIISQIPRKSDSIIIKRVSEYYQKMSRSHITDKQQHLEEQPQDNKNKF